MKKRQEAAQKSSRDSTCGWSNSGQGKKRLVNANHRTAKPLQALQKRFFCGGYKANGSFFNAIANTFATMMLQLQFIFC